MLRSDGCEETARWLEQKGGHRSRGEQVGRRKGQRQRRQRGARQRTEDEQDEQDDRRPTHRPCPIAEHLRHRRSVRLDQAVLLHVLDGLRSA